MIRRLLIVLALLLPTAAYAQVGDLSITVYPSGGNNNDPTAGFLTSDRDNYANWSMAGLLSKGGIPNRTTQCGATLTPSGSDDTSQINTAITNCTAGDYVLLSPGNFLIGEGNYILLNKGITLRGSGPGSTILYRPSGPGSYRSQGTCSSSGAWGATLGCYLQGYNPSPFIIVSPLARFVSNPLTSCALTMNGPKGGTTVGISSSCAGNFHAGDMVLIDEASGAAWQTDIEHSGEQIWASPDYRVTYHIHNPWLSGDDCPDQSWSSKIPSPANGCGVMDQGTFNEDHMTNELKMVRSVSGSNITFDSPLTISYRTANSAALYSFATQPLQEAGVENMTLGAQGSTDQGTKSGADDNALEWDECAYCWAQNVEVTQWLGRGFEMQGCLRCQLEEDYVHEGAWCVPGGGGYNIDEQYATTETLVENTISRACNKVAVVRAAGAGSVFAYNYFDDGYIAGSDSWVEIGLNGSHLVGSHNILFEGNWSWNADSDNTHGNSIYQTYFRNNISGIREKFTSNIDGATIDDSNNGTCKSPPTGPQRVMAPHIYAWWWSDVGNVLGTANCTLPANGWTQNAYYGGSPSNQGVYMWGWDDEDSGYSGDPNLIAHYRFNGPNCVSTSPTCVSIHTNDWLLGWVSNSGQTVFDPNTAGRGFTLSQTNIANDTGTVTATGGSGDVYSTNSMAVTGKKVYWEMACTSQGASMGPAITNTESAASYLGADNNSVAYYTSGGYGTAVVMNGASLGSWSNCASGDTIGITFDTTVNPATISEHLYHSSAWGSTYGPYTLTSNLSNGAKIWLAFTVGTVNEKAVLCTTASCAAGSGSGLPSGAVWYDTVANLNSFNQTPPSAFANSWYLPPGSKPDWWPQNYPWPWVTPEDAPTTPLQSGPVACNGTACSGNPAKARWDAGSPFTQPHKP